jgi:hypothetical protein
VSPHHVRVQPLLCACKCVEFCRSIAAISLGMTLLGMSAHIPGLSTFVTNLIRRGATLSGLPTTSIASKAMPWWYLMLYGDAAKPAALATLSSTKEEGNTPVQEYAQSIDQAIQEISVPPALVGKTFGVVARAAYMRHGVTMIGATVPVNDDITSLVAGLPKTYRLVLFPCDIVLQHGMKLYGITHDVEAIERFRVENGGLVKSAFSRALETVGSAFIIGHGVNSQQTTHHVQNMRDPHEIDMTPVAEMGSPVWNTQPSHTVPVGMNGNEQYRHNHVASSDLNMPWCFTEVDELQAANEALAHKLHLDGMSHIPSFNRFGERTVEACASCNRHTTQPHSSLLLRGVGMCMLGDVTPAEQHGSVLPAVVAPAASTVTISSSDFSFDQPGSAGEAAVGSEASPEHPEVDPSAPKQSPASTIVFPSASPFASRPLVVPRRTSLGDDGLGGIDDTDDISGPNGPLSTSAPHFSQSSGIAITARAAARANVNALAVRLALPVTAVSDVESMAADALDSLATAQRKGHILVCGVSDNIGYLLRALATLNTQLNAPAARSGLIPAPLATEHVEGDQYDLNPEDVVVLAAAKPTDAAANAMYQGSSVLLNKVTFIVGNPAEASDLLKAGVMTARAAIILTASKPTASADGSDNLSDDTDAIVTSSIIGKLNPGLHIVTEILHGSHAPFLRPYGNSLNDAARGALIAILEEREASRQRGKVEDAIKRLALERDIKASAADFAAVTQGSSRVDILLGKLYKQQARLRAAMTGTLVFRPPPAITFMVNAGVAGTLASKTDFAPAFSQRNYSSAVASTGFGAGTPSINTGIASAVAALDAQRPTTTGGFEQELEQLAESGLSNSAIVDVLVGVKEDFGTAAAANDGAAFSMGGGGPGGGQSQGSGATNDLFASPAFASGRVFSMNTMDSIICEALFEPYIINVLKQLVRAARKHRFVAIPVSEAVIMTRLAMPGCPYGPGSVTSSAISGMRDHYMTSLAHKIVNASRGRKTDEERSHEAWMDAPVTTYGHIFEALLRGWHLMAIGMYRRVNPASGLNANPQTTAALQLAAGPPSVNGNFVYNRALVSYVFTNPPPSTELAEHDLIYIMLPESVVSSSGFTDAKTGESGDDV